LSKLSIPFTRPSNYIYFTAIWYLHVIVHYILYFVLYIIFYIICILYFILYYLI
jgi:hypothetical protein